MTDINKNTEQLNNLDQERLMSILCSINDAATTLVTKSSDLLADSVNNNDAIELHSMMVLSQYVGFLSDLASGKIDGTNKPNYFGDAEKWFLPINRPALKSI